MKPSGSKQARCVEALCMQGCRSVRQAIRALQRGQTVRETRELSPQETVEVLKTLQDVMAVYE